MVKPIISIVMPVLNEERNIRSCLDALLAMSFPREQYEILVAYGPSIDNTNSILNEYAKKYDNIKLFENPTGNTAWGRNICVRESRGEFLMNYSGHVVAEEHLLSTLFEKIQQQPLNVASAGCSNVNPEKQSFVGAAAGVVFSSFIGGLNVFDQNAKYDKEQYVDHVSFALYRKKAVKEVGGFDTHFWCGQDAELDIRLRQAGYLILYTPDVVVHHYKRATCKSLFKQMYKYGLARAKMLRKHRSQIQLKYLLGPFLLLAILLALIIVALDTTFVGIVLLFFGMYVFISLFSTLRVAEMAVYVFVSPFFAFIIHTGYGLGFIMGYLYGRVWMR